MGLALPTLWKGLQGRQLNSVITSRIGMSCHRIWTVCYRSYHILGASHKENIYITCLYMCYIRYATAQKLLDHPVQLTDKTKNTWSSVPFNSVTFMALWQIFSAIPESPLRIWLVWANQLGGPVVYCGDQTSWNKGRHTWTYTVQRSLQNNIMNNDGELYWSFNVYMTLM